MKDGAIVCNTGHYDCEIKIPDLEKLSKAKRTVRANNEEYTLKNGRKIYLLAQGRLVICRGRRSSVGSNGYVFCKSVYVSIKIGRYT
jgi:S-adenosylhomocysteine hydrolase